jgi:tRNA threonylcarbamoyladenosine biosynthesis protein TsaB
MSDFANELERSPPLQGTEPINLLAIECTEKNGSVALLTQNGLTFLSLPTQVSTARALAPAIRTVLGHGGLSVRNLERICVTHGPGSFTGLRIGIGLARAMAFGADVPLIGVSSLATLACDYAFPRTEHSRRVESKFVTALNAFRNELFVAAWQVDNEHKLTRLTDDMVIGRQNLAEWTRRICNCDDGFVISPENPTFFGELNVGQVFPTAWGVINAAMFQTPPINSTIDEILPRYLRRSAAEEKRSDVANTERKS